ncbi:MAG: methyltransferase domain-containing protein [Deltaproteobacteria bacterium]|nr:MAG: methyltransferase domain-containing protein [Deltaproteobacteria bacterium]
MSSPRQSYYNLFSKIYDRIIELHSHDRQGRLRSALADRTGLKTGDVALDLCTGTGSVPPFLAEKVGSGGLVVGLDFSSGMLQKAAKKICDKDIKNIVLIQAEAQHLPFKNKTVSAVTCSHAFYELKGDVREKTIMEIKRVCRTGGRFCMMEHEVPRKKLIKFLFYIRMVVAGNLGSKSLLRQEASFFKNHFSDVKKEILPGGNTKVISGVIR